MKQNFGVHDAALCRAGVAPTIILGLNSARSPELSMNEGIIRFPGSKVCSSYRHFSNYASIALSLTAINTRAAADALE